MKSKTLIALAAAGACAWSASAFAGGLHGLHGDTGASVEVTTPSSVNESAPQLSGADQPGESQRTSTTVPESREFGSDSALGTGASSSAGGSGSVGSEAGANETTEYWLIGSESAESKAEARGSAGTGG